MTLDSTYQIFARIRQLERAKIRKRKAEEELRKPKESNSSPGLVAVEDMFKKMRIEARQVAYSKDDPDARLGKGSFGEVFRGFLRGTTPVAVKRITGEVDEKLLNEFRKELSAWLGSNHDNGGLRGLRLPSRTSSDLRFQFFLSWPSAKIRLFSYLLWRTAT